MLAVLLLSFLPQVAAATATASPATVARAVLDAAYPPAFATEAALPAAEQALADCLEQPIAEVLVHRLLLLAERPDVSPAIYRRLQALLDNPKLHGRARHVLRNGLADYQRERGDDAAAARLSPVDEYVRHGLAIGPFGDAGSHWQGVRFPPEFEEPDPRKKLAGRYGPVALRPLAARPMSARLDLPPAGADPRQRAGCHYALLQVSSDTARAAWLEIYSDASLEGFWNGDRFADVDRTTGQHPMRGFFAVQVRAGWNRCWVKTTSERSSSFSLRIVDAKGFALADLTVEQEAKIHPVAATGPAETPPAFVTATDQVAALSAPADAEPVVVALHADLLARDGIGDLAVATAQRAMERGAADPSVRAAAVEVMRQARYLPADVVRTQVRRWLDDPSCDGHRHLFVRKVERLFEDDRREEALRLLAARLAAQPAESVTLELRFRLEEQMRWRGAARRTLDQLLALAPRHPSLVLEASRAIEREGNPRRALQVVLGALADQPGHAPLVERARSLAQRTGDFEQAAQLLARRFRLDPDSDAAKEARADLLVDQSKHAEAAAVLAELAARQPESSALHRRLGDTWFLAGDRDKALDHWTTSLRLRPEQHELRSWILRTSGLPEFAECKQFELDALAEVAAFAPRPEDNAAPATLVLDQMVVRVYPDGSQMEETHILRRVNDKNGIEAYEEASRAAQADELLELRTIHPDGRSFVPHRVADTFSMPQLVPGAFLEERYRNYKPSPGLQPIDFVTFHFSGVDQPYRFSRLVVLMPKGVELGSFVRRNFPASEVDERDLGDLVAHVFLKKDMPKIDDEPGMPAIEEITPSVTFGRSADVAASVRDRRQGFERITVPFREIAARAAAAVEGAGDDREKARRIHELVHELTPDARQQGGSPSPVSVLLKGEGDRFALQLALLRAAQVPWTPAVIRPIAPEMDLGPEPAFFEPRYWGLLAALVSPRGSEPFWIVQDTPRYWPFAVLPSSFGQSPVSGCPFLLLEGDVGRPGRLSGGEPEPWRVRGDLVLRDDDARLEATIEIPGPHGYAIKEQFRLLDQSRRLLEARRFAGRIFAGFTVRKADVLGLDQKGGIFVLQLVLEQRGLVESAGEAPSLLLPLQTTSLTENFGGRGDRKHAFVFPGSLARQWDLRIDPGAHGIGALPPGLLVRRSLIDYAQSYAMEGRQLRVRRDIALRPGRIAPQAYKDFLDLCRQIDDFESRRLRLLR